MQEKNKRRWITRHPDTGKPLSKSDQALMSANIANVTSIDAEGSMGTVDLRTQNDFSFEKSDIRVSKRELEYSRGPDE